MATMALPGIISVALHICDPGDGQVLKLHSTGLHAGLYVSDVNDVI